MIALPVAIVSVDRNLHRAERLTRRSIDLNQTSVHAVGVIGLGYVGLPLALRFAEAGIRVVGFDIDEKIGRASCRVRV